MKKIMILILIILIITYLYKIFNNISNPEMYIYRSPNYNLNIVAKGYVEDSIYINENSFDFFVYKPTTEKLSINEIPIYKIVCGKLEMVGVDENKGYFYGKLNYKKFGGLELYNKNIADSEKEIVRNKYCSGYFMINMNTGGYINNLDKKILEEKLRQNNVNFELLSFKEFMKKNGKFEKCYDLLSCKISRWLIKGYEYKYKLTIE